MRHEDEEKAALAWPPVELNVADSSRGAVGTSSHSHGVNVGDCVGSGDGWVVG